MAAEAAAPEAPADVRAETSRLVSDFIAALRRGDREAAVAAYGDITPEQSAAVGRWLSKAMPFFASGKVETVVEPMCWAVNDAAIVPIRQWRAGSPEAFEIELTCLARRDGKWRLLTDFERPGSAVNGLAESAVNDFAKLMELFGKYKANLRK